METQPPGTSEFRDTEDILDTLDTHLVKRSSPQIVIVFFFY